MAKITLPQITGDGKNFAQAVTKKFNELYNTDQGSVSQVTNITVDEKIDYGDYTNSTIRLIVGWSKPFDFSSADVYVLRNASTVDEIEAADLDALVDDQNTDWIHVGSGINQCYIENAIQYATYVIKVVANNALGNQADFIAAPSVNHYVTGYSYTPDTPTGFQLLFSRGGMKATWNKCINYNLDYYELREDENPGAEAGLLDRVRYPISYFEISVPTNRLGKICLYSRTNTGRYSAPYIHEYDKAFPPRPLHITSSTLFQSFRLDFDEIPDNCLGATVQVNGISYDAQEAFYVHMAASGTYTCKICFYDSFGAGPWSDEIVVTIVEKISNDLLDAGSVTLDKVNSALAASLAKADISIDTSILSEAIATVNVSIAQINEETLPAAVAGLNDSISLLDTAKLSHTEFTTEKNTLVQADADNRSLIDQNASSITSVVGKLNSDPSAVGQYSAISALKQDVTGLTTTVASLSNIAAGTQESASEIAIGLSKNPYSSAVVLNKTAQGGSTSSITLAADSSTTDDNYKNMTVVITSGIGSGQTNVISDYVGSTKVATMKNTWATTPTSASVYSIFDIPPYAAISQLKQVSDNIGTLVAGNKETQDGLNASFQSQIDQAADSITSTIDKLGLEPDAANQFHAVSQIKQQADSISTNVTSLNTQMDSANSSITQNAGDISTVVGELSKDPYGVTPPAYTSFTKIKQTTDAITASVATKASTAALKITDDNITAMVSTLNSAPEAEVQYSAISALSQTATTINNRVSTVNTNLNYRMDGINGSITSIVSELGKSPASCSYSSITQLMDAVNLRVQKGDVVNQINLDSSGILIDGKFVHVTGQTLFDNGIVVANIEDNTVAGTKIVGGSVTADKIGANEIISNHMAANSITGDRIKVNTLNADRIVAGSIKTEQLAAESVVSDTIKSGAILADHISAGAVTADKIAANSITAGELAPDVAAQVAKVDDAYNSATAAQEAVDGILDLSANGKSLNAGAVLIDGSGVKIVEENGDFTKFDSAGLSWYSGGSKTGYIKRVVNGSCKNGQYVTFNTPFKTTPAILLSPKSVQTMVAGYTNSNLQIVCEPYEVSQYGFRVRQETRVLDGSAGTIINLNLYSDGSSATSPQTPLASKDLYATVECVLGDVTESDIDHFQFAPYQSSYKLKNYPYNTVTYNCNPADSSGLLPAAPSSGAWTHSGGIGTHTHNISYREYYYEWTAYGWSLKSHTLYVNPTHSHASYNNGAVTFNFYYRVVGTGDWTAAGSYTFSNVSGPQTYNHTVATSLPPNRYEILVTRSGSSRCQSAIFKAYSVNGGGVIASTGDVSFIAMESDGNTYFTVS